MVDDKRKAEPFEPDLPVHLLELDVRESEEAMKHKNAVINEMIGKHPSFQKAFDKFKNISEEVTEALTKVHEAGMKLGFDHGALQEVQGKVLAYTKDRVNHLSEGAMVMDRALRSMPKLYYSAIMYHVEGLIGGLVSSLKTMIADLEKADE